MTLRATVRRAILVVASASWLWGSIDGVVINGTTGQPQDGVIVNLVHPSAEQGMQTLATTKADADGKFKLDKDVPSPPALLQGLYEGATYTLFLQPGAPTNGLRLTVFEASTKSSDVRLAQHMIMLEPGTDALHVTEVFQFENKGKTTLIDPAKGSVQFYLPKEAQENAKVSIEAPGGMPINRAPEKTAQAGVFKESYPVKPGDATTYELTYSLPPSQKFSGKNLGDIPAMLVTGPSVTLSGKNLESKGQEPKLRAHIYQVPAGVPFEVSIEGTGGIRAEAPQEAGAQQQEDTGQPEPKAGPARIYDRLYWVLALAFVILGLGGTLLYRRGAA